MVLQWERRLGTYLCHGGAIGAFQYVMPKVVRGSVGVPFTARALPDQSPQITTSKRERAAVTLSQPRTTKTHAFTCTLGQTP